MRGRYIIVVILGSGGFGIFFFIQGKGNNGFKILGRLSVSLDLGIKGYCKFGSVQERDL